MGWRQPGDLTQRPSVRTFLVPASGPFSAAGPPASEEYSPSSRLNHDIPNPIVYGRTGFQVSGVRVRFGDAMAATIMGGNRNQLGQSNDYIVWPGVASKSG